MNLTMPEVIGIVSILSSIGVFGAIKFFLTRLVNNIDSKADGKSVESLVKAVSDLKDMFKTQLDGKADQSSVEALVTAVNDLKQMFKENISLKADTDDVEVLKESIIELKDLIKINFAEDKGRDRKLDELVTSVAVLVEQMKNVTNNANPGKVIECETKIIRLESRVGVLEKDINNIALKTSNVEERVIILEKKVL